MKPRIPSPVLMAVVPSTSVTGALVEECITGGVNFINIRFRATRVAELRLRQLIAARQGIQGRSLLALNGYPGMAAEVIMPDAFHVPESESPAQMRLCVGDNWLIGASVHSVAAALRAQREGADYLVAGTIFPSASHPGGPVGGLALLRDVCDAVKIPTIGIGGITPRNAPDCMAAGAAGVAVLSGIVQANDPRRAAAEYWQALQGDKP